MEGVCVEELEDTFADPELAGLFLADVAFVFRVWCVGYCAEGVELSEYVRVICGELVFLL